MDGFIFMETKEVLQFERACFHPAIYHLYPNVGCSPNSKRHSENLICRSYVRQDVLLRNMTHTDTHTHTHRQTASCIE
jgi:hypothetical protein